VQTHHHPLFIFVFSHGKYGKYGKSRMVERQNGFPGSGNSGASAGKSVLA
jgi:hypothetical protein